VGLVVDNTSVATNEGDRHFSSSALERPGARGGSPECHLPPSHFEAALRSGAQSRGRLTVTSVMTLVPRETSPDHAFTDPWLPVRCSGDATFL
jgi:hypothetical protein